MELLQPYVKKEYINVEWVRETLQLSKIAKVEWADATQGMSGATMNKLVCSDESGDQVLSVVVKVREADPTAVSTGLYREAEFYNSSIGKELGIRTPRVYFASANEEGAKAIIMEDLTESIQAVS